MAFNKRVMFGMDGVVSKVIEKLQNLLMPSGCICYFKRSTPPSGWAICDGSVITLRDGTSMTTPNLIGRYPLGATSGIGTNVAAGLPNITGNMSSPWEMLTGKAAATSQGAFELVKSTSDVVNFGTTPYANNEGIVKVNFNASKSNSIYGRVNTVQPPSVKLLPCMKL